MPAVLAIAAIAFLVFIVWTAASRSRDPRPCATCVNCGKLFDDGVMCRFGDREVFKTDAHVKMCIDYRKRA